MKKIAGYGRYDDDPEHIGCPRAKTSETPCVARDGRLAVLDDGTCVGCLERPRDLLAALRAEVGKPSESTRGRNTADLLASLVQEVTKP